MSKTALVANKEEVKRNLLMKGECDLYLCSENNDKYCCTLQLVPYGVKVKYRDHEEDIKCESDEPTKEEILEALDNWLLKSIFIVEK